MRWRRIERGSPTPASALFFYRSVTPGRSSIKGHTGHTAYKLGYYLCNMLSYISNTIVFKVKNGLQGMLA